MDVRPTTTPIGDPAWLVTGYDDVRTLLTDPRLGRSHPEPERAARYSRSAVFGGPLGEHATEAVDHARMRRLLSPAFSARRMAALRPRVRELVDGLLDTAFAGRPPLDLHEAVSFPLPALVICELLGVPAGDRDAFRVWSTDAAHHSDEARSLAGMGALFGYVRELVERKRAEPADDVLSLLVADAPDDPDEVAGLAAGLLFAGHETTAAAIDRGVVLLMTHRDRWDALVRDRSGIPAAVEEVLRVELPGAESPDGGTVRYAAEDLQLGGVRVAAGDLVLLGVHGPNHDPRRFPDPARFDTTRSPNPHLTFGHGPRFCLGAPLARIELVELLDALVARRPDLELAVDPAALRHRTDLITGGLAELPVTWR
jgi:pentalenolactone synthase